MSAAREITTHRGGILNDRIDVLALPGITPGGAHRTYGLLRPLDGKPHVTTSIELTFQHGNPAEEINGFSNEALLAVVRDRLECFQRGPFACESNREALMNVIMAMDVLKHRTLERRQRGVEGELKP